MTRQHIKLILRGIDVCESTNASITRSQADFEFTICVRRDRIPHDGCARGIARQCDELKAIIRDYEKKLLWAEEKYRAMELRYFGQKSEHYRAEDDKQKPPLRRSRRACGQIAAAPGETMQIPAHEHAKRGRKTKTAATERIEIVHDLTDDEQRCPCCGEKRPSIGEDRTAEYDLVPAHVVEASPYHQEVRALLLRWLRGERRQAVVTAAGPAKIIPGSDFTNRTTAFFMTAKYADAIPFYRMEKMLAREGLAVSRAALCNQAVAVGRAVGDLVEAMDRDMRMSPVVLMDETRVKVLNDGRGPPEGCRTCGSRGLPRQAAHSPVPLPSDPVGESSRRSYSRTTVDTCRPMDTLAIHGSAKARDSARRLLRAHPPEVPRGLGDSRPRRGPPSKRSKSSGGSTRSSRNCAPVSNPAPLTPRHSSPSAAVA